MTCPAWARAIGMLLLAPLTVSCGAPQEISSDTPAALEYAAFGAPERVTITGYNGDAMEPFLSRDGHILFFNSAGSPTNKDLYYATFVNPTTFDFRGAVGGVNTASVDGAPTMDARDRFFYVSTAGYDPPRSYDTLYAGVFDRVTGNVTGVAPLSGLARGIAGHLNFDLEVSPDGETLYFDDGVFSGKAFPDSADIAVAVSRNGGFARHPNSAAVLANVNTSDLEYAPAISSDGLELFFTRLNVGRLETTTYRATRANRDAPFSTPQRVTSITGFAEGATLSPDERSLYFHKNDSGAFVLYRVSR